MVSLVRPKTKDRFLASLNGKRCALICGPSFAYSVDFVDIKQSGFKKLFVHFSAIAFLRRYKHFPKCKNKLQFSCQVGNLAIYRCFLTSHFISSQLWHWPDDIFYYMLFFNLRYVVRFIFDYIVKLSNVLILLIIKVAIVLLKGSTALQEYNRNKSIKGRKTS